MAKFGQLYLNGGVWKGKQVISKSWVSESIVNQIPLSKGGDYGYTWWLYKFQIGNNLIDSYATVGWGGQYIFVLPSLNALVVFTNGNFYQQDYSFDMLQNYILPALL